MKHIPKKRFGQNFLKDTSVLADIIDAIAPQPQDNMVEIGPGMGAMTRLLLNTLEKLNVIELDWDLVKYLQNTLPKEKLIIHQGDALAFDMSTLSQPSQKLRIVGNLPYNISSPLLFHLMQFADSVADQHFMLQKEVVERMVALSGTKAYGRLSIMLQWRYHMDMLFVVPPTAFNPPPKVDSAIVRMIPKDYPDDCSFDDLQKVVTQAFSQRRKMLRNNLAPFFSESDLIALDIDPKCRPEDLSLEQFICLANALN